MRLIPYTVGVFIYLPTNQSQQGIGQHVPMAGELGGWHASGSGQGEVSDRTSQDVFQHTVTTQTKPCTFTQTIMDASGIHGTTAKRFTFNSSL